MIERSALKVEFVADGLQMHIFIVLLFGEDAVTDIKTFLFPVGGCVEGAGEGHHEQ